MVEQAKQATLEALLAKGRLLERTKLLAQGKALDFTRMQVKRTAVILWGMRLPSHSSVVGPGERAHVNLPQREALAAAAVQVAVELGEVVDIREGVGLMTPPAVTVEVEAHSILGKIKLMSLESTRPRQCDHYTDFRTIIRCR